MKDLLDTQNLDLIDEHIDHCRKIADQENIIELEHQIMTRRYYWLLEVKRYIRMKISLSADKRKLGYPDKRTKALLKRWDEFDNQYLANWKKELENKLEAIESCYC